MNSKASGSGDVTELWGKKFNVVKNGLSEAQVVSFVNDLAKQHDVLLKRQEHLGALERLAETRVIEADKLVAEMNEEAKSRCESAVAEAQVMSQKVVKEREAEAIAAARKRADEIAAEAKTLANEVINDSEAKANKIISDAAVKARRSLPKKRMRPGGSPTRRLRKSWQRLRRRPPLFWSVRKSASSPCSLVSLRCFARKSFLE